MTYTLDETSTGAPSNVCTLCGRVSAMHWYDDAWIADSQRPGGIMRVPASGGGNPEPLVRISIRASTRSVRTYCPVARRSSLLASAAGGFNGDPVLMLQRLPVGDRLELVRGGSDGRFHLPTGHLLFARGPTLFAAPFDPEVGTMRGMRSRLEAATPVNDEIVATLPQSFRSDQWIVNAPVIANWGECLRREVR